MYLTVSILYVLPVYIELVYPSQLQLSWYLPPFPEAQTNIFPFPFLPFVAPVKNASIASRAGPSTVRPSSSGPQLAEYIST